MPRSAARAAMIVAASVVSRPSTSISPTTRPSAALAAKARSAAAARIAWPAGSRLSMNRAVTAGDEHQRQAPTGRTRRSAGAIRRRRHASAAVRRVARAPSSCPRERSTAVDRRWRRLPMRRISHSRTMPKRSCDPAPHLLAQRLDIGGGRVAGVDQEIGVLFRHHRAAADEAATAGARRSAATPGGRAGWRRSSRRCAPGSAARPRAPHGSRPCAARSPRGSPRCPAEYRAGENPVARCVGMAVGKPEFGAASPDGSCRRGRPRAAETSTSLNSLP